MVGGISSLLLLIWALVTLFLPLVLSARPPFPGGRGCWLPAIVNPPGLQHPMWILLILSLQVCK